MTSRTCSKGEKDERESLNFPSPSTFIPLIFRQINLHSSMIYRSTFLPDLRHPRDAFCDFSPSDERHISSDGWWDECKFISSVARTRAELKDYLSNKYPTCPQVSSIKIYISANNEIWSGRTRKCLLTNESWKRRRGNESNSSASYD